MRQILLVVAVLALLPAAPAAAQDGAAAQLLPGDAVRLTVWRRPELSGEFAISRDGSIAHPLYRNVQIAGVPAASAEGRLREFLSGLEADPQFVMQPLLRVSVGGEVRQPKLYRLPPETTIADAVAEAGGVTERGILARVRLVRGDRQTVVDLTAPNAGLAQDAIQSGDQIFVERRVNVLREYIGPAASIAAAVVSIVNIVLR